MVTIHIDHAERGPAEAPEKASVPPTSGRGSGGGRPSIPTVIVNGAIISRKAIAAEMQNHGGGSAGDALRQAATALIVRELLLQEARGRSLVATPDTDADGRRETDEDALIRALIDADIRVPEADEETLRRYYDNNRQRFASPPLFEADHILFAARRDDPDAFAGARARAEAVLDELCQSPQRFTALAGELSDCPSAGVGGSLGQIGPGDTTPEFEAVLGTLTPSELSGPVETSYGVHLIRLNRRIDGGILPFEAVRDRLAGYLDESVRRRATAQYISRLVGRADIDGFDLSGDASPLTQ